MFSSEPKIGSRVGMRLGNLASSNCWSMVLIRRGKCPRIGEIVEEFADRAKKSPGTFKEFGDAQKEALVRSESNIDLFLNQHALQVDMDKHKTAFLTWIVFIGGPRESRQLLGDLVLTQEDIVSKKEFPDGCLPSTWSIDLQQLLPRRWS